MLTSSSSTAQPKPHSSISSWIIRHIFPIGWLALLTGLFWVGDRALYHKLYYSLLVAPMIVAVTMQPRQISPLIRNPLIFAFIIFASYIILTLLWSDTDTASFSLLKRPIYVLTMLLSAAMLAMERPPALGQVMKTSAVIAAVAAALSFGYYLYNANFSLSGQRFSGYGALYNPLLSAHVYGFFATFWLAYWFTTRQQLAPMPLICLAVLGTAIIATGSRTPLLALSAVAAWLGFAQPGRRSLLLLLTAVGTGLALLILHPASLISRGLSYRPDIWSEALALAAQRPWLGYGFDHQLLLELKQAGLTFNDPHNIELAVLLAGGLIGLALWFLLYGMAILYSWRNRHNSTVLVASSLLIFGFFAGLTEGRDFLSRPKEHWFLIWIPFALLINAWLCSKRKTDFSRPPL